MPEDYDAPRQIPDFVDVPDPVDRPMHWWIAEPLPRWRYGTTPVDMFEITREVWATAPAAYRLDYQPIYSEWFHTQRRHLRRVFRYLDMEYDQFVWVAFDTERAP